MSRALTVYSRREAATKHEPGEIERIMEAQGCSEPVAKNLIKYAKLGIGPLCGTGRDSMMDREAPSSGSSREQFPPRLDRKAAALLAEQKLRERQEAEEEAEERQRQPKRRIGMAPLGAVMRREEEVDPFRAPAPRSAPRKEEEEEKSDEDQMQNLFNARPQNKGPLAKKMMQIGGISLQKPRSREEVAPMEHASASKAPHDAEPENEEDENHWGEDERSRQFVEPESNKKKTQNQLEDERRRGAGKRKKQSGKKNERDASPEEEERSPSPEAAAGSDNKGGSLMTEAQIMALMGKNKKKDGYSRGSVRAKTRIQKESQEWESRKASNPEFWKAPQFALCYSAETGKRARGAG